MGDMHLLKMTAPSPSYISIKSNTAADMAGKMEEWLPYKMRASSCPKPKA